MNTTFVRAALLAPLLLAFAACAGAVFAQPAHGRPPRNMKTMPKAAMVLEQIHLVNHFEIKAATLAGKKAQEKLVKRYADRLRQDHHVADGKVEALANKLGVQLHSAAQMRKMVMPRRRRQSMTGTSGMSSGAGSPKQKMRMKLSKMHHVTTKLKSTPPRQFDRAYLMAMVKSHKMAINQLQKVQGAKLGKHKVVHLVGLLLPILKQHLALAEHLKSKLASSVQSQPQHGGSA
jgi:predicted outer membrane protein